MDIKISDKVPPISQLNSGKEGIVKDEQSTFDINKVFITFLKDLQKQIENNTLSSLDKRKIGEFILRYHFEKEVEEMTDEISEDEVMRYTSIGWYVYNVILNREELSS